MGAFHAARPGGRSSNIGRVSGLLPSVDAARKVVSTSGPGGAEPDRSNDSALQALATMNNRFVGGFSEADRYVHRSISFGMATRKCKQQIIRVKQRVRSSTEVCTADTGC